MYCSSWNSRCRCYRLPIPLTRKTCHSAEHLMSNVFWGLNFLGSMWNCDRVFLQAHPWSHLGVCVSQDEFWEELRKTGGRKTKQLQVEESLHIYKLWNVPKSLFFQNSEILVLWDWLSKATATPDTGLLNIVDLGGAVKKVYVRPSVPEHDIHPDSVVAGSMPLRVLLLDFWVLSLTHWLEAPM
jgi:hypothetical protein